MVNMRRVEAKIREVFTEMADESKPTQLLEQLIDEETENAEVIGTLLDRIEKLESQVQSLNDRLGALNEDRS